MRFWDLNTQTPQFTCKVGEGPRTLLSTLVCGVVLRVLRCGCCWAGGRSGGRAGGRARMPWGAGAALWVLVGGLVGRWGRRAGGRAAACALGCGRLAAPHVAHSGSEH